MFLDFLYQLLYLGPKPAMAFSTTSLLVYYGLWIVLLTVLFHKPWMKGVFALAVSTGTLFTSVGLFFPSVLVVLLLQHYRETYLHPLLSRFQQVLITLISGLVSVIIVSLLHHIFFDLEDIFVFNPNSPLIFTKFYFWAFFAVVITLYSSVYQKIGIRNAFLGIVSLFFYYKTSGLFFLLLVFSTITDYWIGLRLDKTYTPFKRNLLVGLSVFLNLSTLIYFKYAYFFTDAYNQMFHSNFQVINWLAYWSNGYLGTNFDINEILLPVGVSFFTFQTISYSVDVYRRQIKPVTRISDFSFYVSYFPQLVAGPIVRANEFVPQIYEKYHVTRYEFGLAIFWILNGLIKKMIIGDYMAVNFIDRVFDYPENYTGFGVLMALFTYSLQVYADFSGYTDIAIGVSLLMGFRLPVNFNSPYKARNVAEFWKRWHMSLSTWLKDYLYIPLGGNRKSSFGTWFWSFVIIFFVTLISGGHWWKVASFFAILSVIGIIMGFISPVFKKSIITNINLMITMVIGGLWHGASWNFVIWGTLNGMALVIYKAWKKISPYEKSNHWAVVGWKVFFTFSFISFTRLFFRAGDIKNTGNGMELVSRMWNQLMTNWSWDATLKILENHWTVFLIFLLGMIIHWLPVSLKMKYRHAFVHAHPAVQISCIVGVVFLIYQFITSDLQAFIYFQF